MNRFEFNILKREDRALCRDTLPATYEELSETERADDIDLGFELVED